MTRRYFWQVPEFIKYRTVFENREAIIGVNENNEHRTFRKDTGRICFDERQALLQRLTAMERDEAEVVPLPPPPVEIISPRFSYLHC